jgi:heterodisulfide reductase subunit A
MTVHNMTVDALVVGGGIAGMQSALDLADQGYQVALVEKEASIGGKMIMLSKVFPTLDCCSCITTPKMSAVAHHDNIQLLTYCEVQSLDANGDADAGYHASVLQKPRYVDMEACTGCRQCEYACPLDMPSAFDQELGAVRPIRVPFSTAVPQKAMIDIDNCLLCGKCAQVCPTDAIDFGQQPETLTIDANAVVLATGFEMTPTNAKAEYGADDIDNVVNALVMERLLAPTGPYGHVLRPSDGKEPDSIAYVQCAGSRDQTLGVEYCSRVCCMYAIKQAMLLSGALPLADITIYYMDIRTFGKGYEQFYQNAKAMGIEFVKGKVARISEDADQNPVVRVEVIDEASSVVERTHDLVVLSVGMLPGYDPRALYGVSTADDGFAAIPQPNIRPGLTDRPGIFVTGTAGGPMDIVDSIVLAGAAAAETAAYLEETGRGHAAQVAVAKEAVHA